MNRKGSLLKVTSAKPAKGSSLLRLSKVSLGCPMSVNTPVKALGTPLHASLRNLSVAGSMRASSGFGMSKKKPWDISDPAFRTRCIDKVFSFLLSNNFDDSITKISLKSPTAKNFICIFTFIYHFIDPSFKLVKMEDQIPKIMKSHSCPIQLAKSTFLNVGSPHAWPAVLAMLAWLCDIVSLADDDSLFQKIFTKDFDSERSEAECKLKFMVTWHNSNNSDCSQLIQELKADLEAVKCISDEDFNDALVIHDDFAVNLEEVPCMEHKLAAVKEEYYGLQRDYDNCTKYVEILSTKIGKKDSERHALEVQRVEIQATVKKVEEEITRIKEHKMNQELSEEEVAQIKCYKQKYISSMNYYKQEENDIKEKLWKMETELSRLRTNKLPNLVLKFASKCRKIELPDSSFLLNDDMENYNKNKDQIDTLVKKSLGNLISKIAFLNDELATTLMDNDQEIERISDCKKKLLKLEKALEQSNVEKNQRKQEIKIENERCQTEHDKLSDEILGFKKRIQSKKEFNSCKKEELLTLTNQFKSVFEKDVEERELCKRILIKKRSNVDRFLERKVELLAQHKKIMEEIAADFL